MKHNDIWQANEKMLIEKVLGELAGAGMIDAQKQLCENLVALEYQSVALSLYPSILQSNRIGGSERNLETLVTVLSEKYHDEDIFVMPTKAILSRSYEIGKINLLYMIKHLTSLLDVGKDELFDPFPFINNRMLSIMTEDVLLDILSGPIHKNAKSLAVAALAQIWEGRISAESIAFSPELRNMWMIRRKSIPIYGSLLGIHEYISLCKNTDGVGLNYILHATDFPDEASALEEFIFGISYEDLCILKKHMEISGKTCVNRNEIADVIGLKNINLDRQCEDPLELYRFYNHRRKSAMLRRHSKCCGPIKTFEEYFMLFLLLGSNKKIKSGETSINNQTT